MLREQETTGKGGFDCPIESNPFEVKRIVVAGYYLDFQLMGGEIEAGW